MTFNRHLLPPPEGRPTPVVFGLHSAYQAEASLGVYSLISLDNPKLDATHVVQAEDEGSVSLKGILHVSKNLFPEEDLTILLSKLDLLDDLDDRNLTKWRYNQGRWTGSYSKQYRLLMRQIARERSHRRVVFVTDVGYSTDYAKILATFELRRALSERENA